MQVQRDTAVLAKRELENLIGPAAQGFYSGETRHESRGNNVDWMKHTHTLSRLVAKHVEVWRPRRWSEVSGVAIQDTSRIWGS